MHLRFNITPYLKKVYPAVLLFLLITGIIAVSLFLFCGAPEKHTEEVQLEDTENYSRKLDQAETAIESNYKDACLQLEAEIEKLKSARDS